jgi:amino acid adenylation domain-containing protein
MSTEDAKSLCDIVRRHAAATPDATAVMYQQQRLTYAELVHRASRLARHLRRAGVTADAVVGIYVERSLNAAVAILATLESGGACLPLDPDDAPERVSRMLEDARAVLLLTDRSLSERRAQITRPIACLSMESVESVGADQDETDAGFAPNHPDNAAYVIYTSGSTGSPKGVVISHQALMARLQRAVKGLGLTRDDTVAVIAPLSFGISPVELLAPWVVGGCCALVDRRDVLRHEVLVEHLTQVSVFHATPGLMQCVIEATETMPSHRRPAPRLVFTGGDVVPVSLLQQVTRVFESATVCVAYGTTETPATATMLSVSVGLPMKVGCIGKAFEEGEAYVLDDRMQRAAIGQAGGIYLGGPGLARGYLDKPGLTAGKFVAHPFSERHGQRLYFTGDVGRYEENGQITLIGRMDRQVKVRGIRVEPGEVEAIVSNYPGVKQAMVTAERRANGDNVLVAYVRGDFGALPQPLQELRAFVARHVPRYMVPAVFRRVDQFPFGENDKLDRQALSALIVEDDLDDSFESDVPRSPTEDRLTHIWADVLDLSHVDVYRTFTDLGGHSLAAMRCRARVQRELQVDVPIEFFFSDHSSIAEMSATIDASMPLAEHR